MIYVDESEGEELAAQLRYERRTAHLRSLNPRDPDYWGDLEDYFEGETDEI